MTTLFHLAEFIEDELAARGWSRDHFTSQMVDPAADPREWQITRAAVDLFLDVREPGLLLGDFAAKFSKALGVSEALFQALHDRWRAAQPHGDALGEREKL